MYWCVWRQLVCLWLLGAAFLGRCRYWLACGRGVLGGRFLARLLGCSDRVLRNGHGMLPNLRVVVAILCYGFMSRLAVVWCLAVMWWLHGNLQRSSRGVDRL